MEQQLNRNNNVLKNIYKMRWELNIYMFMPIRYKERKKTSVKYIYQTTYNIDPLLYDLSFLFERTRCRLFQKRTVRAICDTYVFIVLCIRKTGRSTRKHYRHWESFSHIYMCDGYWQGKQQILMFKSLFWTDQ